MNSESTQDIREQSLSGIVYIFYALILMSGLIYIFYALICKDSLSGLICILSALIC